MDHQWNIRDDIYPLKIKIIHGTKFLEQYLKSETVSELICFLFNFFY